jgi:hypothetical protein
MMLNSDLCMIFDDSLDSVNCDACLLNRPEFIALPGGAVKNAIYAFCLDIRGKGHYLNAKEKMCCAWARPDKMMIQSNWHKNTDPTSIDMAFPLPALYSNQFDDNHHCGVNFTEGTNPEFKIHCCGREDDGKIPNCDYQGNFGAPAWAWIQKFAYDENLWLEAFVEAWEVATSNSVRFVHATSANIASADHLQDSKKECGTCRDPAKTHQFGDESWEESEALRKEDTYSKSFWDERKKTWPMWTDATGVDPAENLQRDSIVTKAKRVLEANGLDTTWMETIPDDTSGEACR